MQKVSSQDLISLAKQGDHRAIAFLISEALNSQGIRAKATREKDDLYILLESQHLPSEEACLSVIEKGLERLQLEGVNTVTVYGRLKGDSLPSWSHILTLPGSLRKKEKSSEAPQQKHETNPPKKSVTPQSPHPLEISLSSPSSQTKNPWTYVAVSSLVLLPLSGFVLNNQFNRFRQPNISLLNPEKPLAESVLKINTNKTTPSSHLKKSQSLPSQLIAPKNSPSSVSTPVIKPISTPKAFQASPPPTSQSMPTTAKTETKSLSSPLPSPQISPTVIPVKSSPISPVSIPSSDLSNVSFTLKAVGDIIPGTNYPYNKLPQKRELLFSHVKSQLQGADLVFGNFESTLTNHPHSAKNIGRGMVFAFRTPPDYTKLLKEAGFNILNIANNHSFDFHEKGFKDTIDNINQHGMKAVGKKDQIVYETVNNLKVAFIGFSNYDGVHNSILNIKASQALIKKAKEQANIVVISIHAGAEGTGALNVKNKTEYFYGENRGNLVLFSRSAIDAGADLILGHGPHVPRALELYKGKLIAYSLGNFLGYRTLSTSGVLGKSLILEAKLNGEGDFISGKIIPIKLNSSGIPYVDNDFHSVGLIRNLTQSDFPETPLKIDNKGLILKK